MHNFTTTITTIYKFSSPFLLSLKCNHYLDVIIGYNMRLVYYDNFIPYSVKKSKHLAVKHTNNRISASYSWHVCILGSEVKEISPKTKQMAPPLLP